MSYDAYQSYQTVSLHAQTAQASPLQLVLVLMDGLLDELARARAHIQAKRYELKAASLERCVSIINGLSSALDLDGGGEVVHNLARLYDYCAERLYRADYGSGARDAAGVLALAAERANVACNVGTGKDTTIAALAEILIKAVGADVEPVFNPRDVLVARRAVAANFWAQRQPRKWSPRRWVWLCRIRL